MQARRSARWMWGDVLAMPRSTSVVLRHVAGGAELLVCGGRLRRSRGYHRASTAERRALARAGAILLLRARGRYLVHASGVVSPEGRAWMLLGDSGCGKSTLAYSLARQGWQVLGDDGVIVEPDDTGVAAHPWRAPLRVSHELAASFPELASLPIADERDPRRRVWAPAATSRRARLAGLLVLELAHGAGGALPITQGAALSALIRQSPWVALHDAVSRSHFAALASVARVPAWRLRHGFAELSRLGGMLARLRT